MTARQPTLDHVADQVAKLVARQVAIAQLHADAAVRALADKTAGAAPADSEGGGPGGK